MSASLPVKVTSCGETTILRPVKMGIVVLEEIARSTSFNFAVNAERLIVNFI
jgi:hypothetical protein